jgi:LysR family transcriptional regulator, low CO2-responsive transcriptional regulator
LRGRFVVTFTQLQALVAIARCGSVKAAALEMQISQAAVSQAVASLRREFDDEIYVREGRGVTLTARGRQLAGAAAEIIGLAENAHLPGSSAEALLRVTTTGTVAEYVVGSLLDAFMRRVPALEVQAAVDSSSLFNELLRLRRADVTIGPDPIHDFGIECVPFLRYEMTAVSRHGRQHDPAGKVEALVQEQWLLGPNDSEPSSEVGRFLVAGNRSLRNARVFPSHAAAAAAAAAGHGITMAIAHTVTHQLASGILARVGLAGTPVKGMWYASTLAGNLAPRPAAAFRRFVATPEAARATLTGEGGVAPGRLSPPTHITLWSGIARKVAP